MRYLHLCIFAIALTVCHLSVQAQDYRLSLRPLGHQLLLAAGDSTSRVLPVQETDAKAYRLTFEKPFSFEPDSLAAIAKRLMQTGALPASYTLSVSQAGSHDVLYGFTGDDVTEGTVPCAGRAMPMGPYVVNISITPATSPLGLHLIVSGLLLLATATLGYRFYRQKQYKPVLVPAQSGISIGAYRYLAVEGLLVYGQETTPLTGKEQTLLNIFVKQINDVIDRNQLLKEGWEDEGVITGRSLDMYVSKLRKKLQHDPGISIKNVHGKGYSLCVR